MINTTVPALRRILNPLIQHKEIYTHAEKYLKGPAYSRWGLLRRYLSSSRPTGLTSNIDVIRQLHNSSSISSPLEMKPLVGIKRHVHIIYTGGTIGMKKNSDGSLAPAPGFLPEVVS